MKGPSTVTEADDLRLLLYRPSGSHSLLHSGDLGSSLGSDMEEVDSRLEAWLGSCGSVQPMAAVVDA